MQARRKRRRRKEGETLPPLPPIEEGRFREVQTGVLLLLEEPLGNLLSSLWGRLAPSQPLGQGIAEDLRAGRVQEVIARLQAGEAQQTAELREKLASSDPLLQCEYRAHAL